MNQYGGLHFSEEDVSGLEIEIAPTDAPVNWQLIMTRPGVDNLRDEVEDLFIILGYEWEGL